MNKIYSRLKFAYYYIVNSIGFEPTIIAILFALLALVMLYLETLGISKTLQDNMSFVIISNGNTARLILSSITTGIISLTVFSFTMVMLVLNQAGANFTPRVIPGLISYKSNQRVMGIYLGTLVYTLIIMVNVHSDYYSIPLPGFSIFLAMCFTMLCLGFFVYFIHSISLSIQIESILESIFEVTKKKIEEEVAKFEGTSIPNVFQQEDWIELVSTKTGYLQSIDEEAVLSLCKKHDVVLRFEQPLGGFVIEGIPFLLINKDLEDKEEFLDELQVHLNYYREERPNVNYLFGFKHITESAVKALSPSLNDPGTAIRAIDYLTDLFMLRMRLQDDRVIFDKEGAGRIQFNHETFDNLYALCLSPIRQYGKDSSVVVLRLFFMFKNLMLAAKTFPDRTDSLFKEVKLLLEDVDEAIRNPGDREKINDQVQDLNLMGVFPHSLPKLTTPHTLK